MSEEFGDDDEVGPAAHEARGERMAQDVGGGVVVQRGGVGDRGDDLALGRLRADSVEVVIAPWLVRQLLTGTVVLDWRTQRKLAGAAKRLWYQLSALAPEFEPTAFPDEVALTIRLDADVYTGLHLQAARERDNRVALTAAARRIVAADPTYRSVQVLRADDGGYVLRATRILSGHAGADVSAHAVDTPQQELGQLQLGHG